MFEMNDVIGELCLEFPEIEKKSIEKICKQGLSGLRKLMNEREEVLISTEGKKEVKFYIPTTPEIQHKITMSNVFKRKRRELRKQNGKTSK